MEAFLGSGLLQRVGIPIDHHAVMELTAPEMGKARAIKAAVELDTNIDNLSDFEYVQYALTHGADIEGSSISAILEHISRMQAFRQVYNIQDTVAEGIACIKAAIEQHPGFLLSIHYSPETGNCTAVEDWAQFFPGIIASTQQYACLIKALYYRFKSLNPTFLAIRLGLSHLIECLGVTSQNYDSALQERMLAELLISYPTRYLEMYLVNATLVVNTAIALWKRHMSKNLKASYRLGSQIPGLEGSRISDLFRIPTPEIADEATIHTTRRLLEAGYQNQATYQLPPTV